MQDTTSSAMTEVALGLSMAFFTLLIVALLSMSVPKESTIEKLVKTASNTPKDLIKNEAINIQMNSDKNVKPSNKKRLQFAFYFKKKFYDKTLTLRSIERFSQEEPLVIAVDPTLAFADVFALRQQIQHPNLSITTSNKAWNKRLKQMKTLD